MELINKIIWITGASSGIGEALCYELNKAGAKLIISSRSSDGLYQVKQKCAKSQIDVHVLPLDLENTAELPDKAKSALTIFGRIDIIIHSGDISNVGGLREIENFCEWFSSLSQYKHKIFIAGNHDFVFEKDPILPMGLC